MSDECCHKRGLDDGCVGGMGHGEYQDSSKRPLTISCLLLPPGSNLGEVHVALNDFSHEFYSQDTYRGDFTGLSGEWTITINELVFRPQRPADKPTGDYGGTAADVRRLPGPWVFTFQVP